MNLSLFAVQVAAASRTDGTFRVDIRRYEAVDEREVLRGTKGMKKA
jgi:hypothetical protein